MFDLPKLHPTITVNYNFFGEKHGKSCCDSEFSVITKWFHEITNKITINTTEDLLIALSRKADANGGPKRHFLIYERDQRPASYPHFSCPDFKTIHSYERSGDQVMTRTLTKQQKPVAIKFKMKDERKSKIPPPVDRSFNERHRLTEGVLKTLTKTMFNHLLAEKMLPTQVNKGGNNQGEILVR